jgi:hypothetical protein
LPSPAAVRFALLAIAAAAVLFLGAPPWPIDHSLRPATAAPAAPASRGTDVSPGAGSSALRLAPLLVPQAIPPDGSSAPKRVPTSPVAPPAPARPAWDGSAHRTIGILRSVNCGGRTLVLQQEAGGSADFVMTPATVAYAQARKLPDTCALARLVGTRAVVWWTANGTVYVASRVDVVTLAGVPAAISQGANPADGETSGSSIPVVTWPVMSGVAAPEYGATAASAAAPAVGSGSSTGDATASHPPDNTAGGAAAGNANVSGGAAVSAGDPSSAGSFSGQAEASGSVGGGAAGADISGQAGASAGGSSSGNASVSGGAGASAGGSASGPAGTSAQGGATAGAAANAGSSGTASASGSAGASAGAGTTGTGGASGQVGAGAGASAGRGGVSAGANVSGGVSVGGTSVNVGAGASVGVSGGEISGGAGASAGHDSTGQK